MSDHFELSTPLQRKAARDPHAVERWVDDIISIGRDPEASHGEEDSLLWAIAEAYAPEAVVAALVRLKQAGLTRWYA